MVALIAYIEVNTLKVGSFALEFINQTLCLQALFLMG